MRLFISEHFLNSFLKHFHNSACCSDAAAPVALLQIAQKMVANRTKDGVAASESRRPGVKCIYRSKATQPEDDK